MTLLALLASLGFMANKSRRIAAVVTGALALAIAG